MKLEQAASIIKHFYLKERRMPVLAEVKELLGYRSRNAAFETVQKLVDMGVIEKGEHGKLLPKDLMSIPHLGIIKAGLPMPAFENHESIDVYRYLYSSTKGDIYFLTVSGKSMINAHIDDGDKVIVDPSLKPTDGDVVAAIVDGDWTVKHFYTVNGEVELRPANDDFPVIKPKYSLEIGGVVTAVIRKYH